MAYQSIHTGKVIDEGISINSSQNEKISNLESKDTELNSKITSLQSDLSAVYLKVYSVGCIYMSTNSTSPASLFGGTWEQLKDRFLLGAGDSYSAGSTGGEAAHTLTVEEMANHDHDEYADFASSRRVPLVSDASYGDKMPGAYFYPGTVQTQELLSYNVKTGKIGGSQPHNNMPPYLTVYMWKRIA